MTIIITEMKLNSGFSNIIFSIILIRNSQIFEYNRQDSTIYALKVPCFNKGVIGTTTKKGEDYTNKSTVKTLVTLFHSDYFNNRNNRNILRTERVTFVKNSSLIFYRHSPVC